MTAIECSARLSADGVYRYTLTRTWDHSAGAALFVMLNPSTADATVDDPTIRRCLGFVRAWGYGELLVANLFAWRATDPKALPGGPEAVGPENDWWLTQLSRRASITVAAWGANPATLRRSAHVRTLLDGVPHVLKLTRRGNPAHPLYLRADLQPVPWLQPTEHWRVERTGERWAITPLTDAGDLLMQDVRTPQSFKTKREAEDWLRLSLLSHLLSDQP